MRDFVNRFISNNYSLSITLGIVAALGGLGLAFLSKDAEPWGTVGGFFFGFGLIFVIHTIAAKYR